VCVRVCVSLEIPPRCRVFAIERGRGRKSGRGRERESVRKESGKGDKRHLGVLFFVRVCLRVRLSLDIPSRRRVLALERGSVGERERGTRRERGSGRGRESVTKGLREREKEKKMVCACVLYVCRCVRVSHMKSHHDVGSVP